MDPYLAVLIIKLQRASRHTRSNKLVLEITEYNFTESKLLINFDLNLVNLVFTLNQYESFV